MATCGRVRGLVKLDIIYMTKQRLDDIETGRDRPVLGGFDCLGLRPRGDEARERFENSLNKLYKTLESFDYLSFEKR